jgi:hypothetical protein
MRDRWKKLPPFHFKRVWWQNFAKSISKFGKEDLRTAAQFLNRHCELNYHINKHKPKIVSKTFPHCLMAETMNHFIGKCPKWSYQRGGYFNQRGGYFNSFSLSTTDVVDRFSLRRIVSCINSTKRFNNYSGNDE